MHPRARSSADILASAKAAPTAHFKNYKKARTDTGGPKNRGSSAIYAHALSRFPANGPGLVSAEVSRDELVAPTEDAHHTTQALQNNRLHPPVFTFKSPITPISYREYNKKACNCVAEVTRRITESHNETTLNSSDSLTDNQELELNTSSDTLMDVELAYPSESTVTSSPSTANESRGTEILGLLREEGLDPFDLFLMVFDPQQPKLNVYQAEILDDSNPKLFMILDRIIAHSDGRAKVSQWLKRSGLSFVHDIVSQEMEEVQRTAKLPGPVCVDAGSIKTCISGYPALVPWTTEVLSAAAEASLAHARK
ncbi:hypothetical protein HYPSUDRAFT_415703 [Hypholoma sublateritium FD-334 SS-4]|uniref:Uncharacterized protein n=1 Tax=Hypholoma sublateritium (strain FD-334 SS-4) TaxID=945553 RepID=A0A0D2P2P6_HYPSF|nr:hypothetical protein HYPSUDRAFT_415703 [Hypholoma sublateritium FD-334 SS-4]